MAIFGIPAQFGILFLRVAKQVHLASILAGRKMVEEEVTCPPFSLVARGTCPENWGHQF